MIKIFLLLLVPAFYMLPEYNILQERADQENEITLDTTRIFDSKRKLEVLVILPVSGIKLLDNIVSDEINKQKEKFIKNLDEDLAYDSTLVTAIGSDFYAEPVSIYKDNILISYCFLISYYLGGHVHPLTSYYSFNYHLGNNSLIEFDDYFSVHTYKDSLFLIEKITKTINREGVGVDSVYPYDFNIEADSVSFNFDDYEIASYAEGVIRSRIAKAELIGLIKTPFVKK